MSELYSLAISETDTEVNGKFKTLDMYRKEYGDMRSDEAKAYTSRLITEVCMSLFFEFSSPFLLIVIEDKLLLDIDKEVFEVKNSFNTA